MDLDDSFYDELSSFMPSPNEYGLNSSDLDEIIGSTVSHLDSSLDLNTFIPPPPPAQQTPLQQHNYVFSDLERPAGQRSLDFDFNLGTLSSFSSPASSTSSVEGQDYFDDLMNFLNDDATKTDELTRCNLLVHTQARNTPSPTGSCSSSSGSSTSGVHSDTSDTCSRNSVHNENASFDSQNAESKAAVLQQQLLPVVVPEVQQQAEPVKHNNLQPGSLLTFPTVPPVAVKVQTSLPMKTKVQPEVKLVTTAPMASKVATATTAHPSKPKTIFLSSNDFKALMQKMNSNGTKGARINGSVSAQIPKIIVKTNNGNVIATNKLVQPVNVSKMVKPQATQPDKGGPHSRPVTNGFAPPKTGSSSALEPPSVYRGLIDEKIYKKQQRMIKNRESASLSRKKKRDYVASLETRINSLELENYTLKGENVTLRNQLVAFAKTCKCRNSHVSEFVLNSLNANTMGEQQHVRIAPKPTAKSLKQRMSSATVKKNMAVLFAMAFMVTLNAGNFQSYLHKQNSDRDGAVLESIVEEPMATGRRLLWVDTETEYNEKLNRSKRQALESEVPPLHFLRPANRSNNATANPLEPPPLASASPPRCNGGCSASGISANQSEYSRLARNLHKWIDGNDYLNLSMHSKFENELENPHGFKLTTDFLKLENEMEPVPSHPGKRKLYMNYNKRVAGSSPKQRIINTPMHGHDKATLELDNNNSEEHSLKLYKSNINEEYLRLFKGIKRQDDTFYVLSFNMDHILLPASAYNKSSRPKMSLLLPTGDPTRNGDVVLMQIDCEVFNTTQLELKAHMIPTKLRPNVTKWHPSTPKSTDVASNEAQNAAKPQNKMASNDPPKEKPRVRTYFMVGPKNQAAAAASLEKPRLVRFNSSMANGSELSVDNPRAKKAMLYARSREAVQSEFGP